MRQRQPVYLIISAIFTLLTACTSSKAIESQTTIEQKLDLAVVQEINILKVSSDVITLVATRQLPNPCSHIEKSDIERNGDAIIVSIYQVKTENDVCEINPVDFNEEISIDLSGNHDIRYRVIVNGVRTTALIPATSNSSIVLDSTPTPTIDLSHSTEVITNLDEVAKATEEPPSEVSQVSPTATQTAQPTETAADTEQAVVDEAQVTHTVQEVQPTTAPTDSDVGDEECTGKAAFYADVSVPDNTIFKPGETFEKIWRVRNEGTCTWNDGYSLAFAGGEVMNGSLSNRIPIITPGEISDISIDIQAPARWGRYTGNWHFENGRSERFGVGAGGHDYIWVQIFVDSPAPAPTSNTPLDLHRERNQNYLSKQTPVAHLNQMHPMSSRYSA